MVSLRPEPNRMTTILQQDTVPTKKTESRLQYSGRGYRIESVDLLRGLLMILMALDHGRDYFSSASIDPTDPIHSWPALFITRWVTHLCAPGFILLAGASAYLQRQCKSAATLTHSLLLRGLWLIFIEMTVVSFGWSFGFGAPIFQVIWVIGICMIMSNSLTLVLANPGGNSLVMFCCVSIRIVDSAVPPPSTLPCANAVMC